MQKLNVGESYLTPLPPSKLALTAPDIRACSVSDKTSSRFDIYRRHRAHGRRTSARDHQLEERGKRHLVAFTHL